MILQKLRFNLFVFNKLKIFLLFAKWHNVASNQVKQIAPLKNKFRNLHKPLVDITQMM